MNAPLVRSVRDSARASGYPRDGLYAAVAEGRLRVIRRGKRILVPVRELESFIERESARQRGDGEDSPPDVVNPQPTTARGMD